METKEIPVTLFLPEPEVPRSPGVHISGIIRCIATEQGILKPEWAEELSLVDIRTITDKVALIRISIGIAWEQYYIPKILGHTMDVVDHPGEMELEGVYMTHDGESVSAIVLDKDRLHLAVHEVKATYKSTKTVGDLRSQWMWLAQIKAYCKAKRTRFAFLHVLFLCGNYKFPITPQLRCWAIEFTEEELDENWTLLRDYKIYRLQIEEGLGGL